MNAAEAQMTDAMLEDVQRAQGRVPVEEFRLRLDCAECTVLSRSPATAENNVEVRVHILTAHADEVLT